MPLKPSRKALAAAALVGSMLTGGAVGVVMFGPQLAGAQTTSAPQTGASAHSNEDPAHEATESADREAAETTGTFRGHGGGSNEDATHEAGESAGREAAESSQAPASAPAAPAAPGASVTNL